MNFSEKHLRHTMKEHTQTQTINEFDTSTAEASAKRSVEKVLPRLRILYHTDLDRVGQVSSPEAFSSTGASFLLGRKERNFVGHDGQLLALEDPTISRKHCRLHWLAQEEIFEVEPFSSARLALHALPPYRKGTTYQPRPIEEPTRLTPGSCLVIGNRLILGLECVRTHHSAKEDRLGLIGESEEMWALRRKIKEVASLSRPVMVLGPTGCGKELVSHAIHQQSSRQMSPFVIANCAALPDNLVESLLFGHRQGAFTGANTDHLGFFREADQGTLFLDELCEFQLTLQPKLLRVIQDGQIRPVGEQRSTKVDVRLIAATNRHPQEEIAEGRMREDLYHRLATYLIDVPSLNERQFDIPELFVAFLRRYSAESPQSDWLWQRHKKWKEAIPLTWFIELMYANWTGNVRQLENVAAQTIQGNFEGPPFQPPPLPELHTTTSSPTMLSEDPKSGDDIEEKDDVHFLRTCELLDLAPKTVRKLLDQSTIMELWRDHEDDTSESRLAESLKEAASAQLLAQLEADDFSQRRTARQLNISPSTLGKLMLRFDLPRPTDLTIEMIDAAIAEVGEDLDAVAKRLRVSAQGLRRQLTMLNLWQS